METALPLVEVALGDYSCYAICMKATTIKVEGELLERIERCRPKGQSITAFVRDVLEHEVRRYEMSLAADAYARFLDENEDERSWLEEWDSSDLARPPQPTTS